MKRLHRLLFYCCPLTGGTWPVVVHGSSFHGTRLTDHTARPKPSKPERAAQRRRRRWLSCSSLLPDPTPRLALDDPERTRLYAEVKAVGYCQHCRRPYRLTVDHIVPLVLGGGNHRANLQCLCRRCNRAKGRAIWAAAA